MNSPKTYVVYRLSEPQINFLVSATFMFIEFEEETLEKSLAWWPEYSVIGYDSLPLKLKNKTRDATNMIAMNARQQFTKPHSSKAPVLPTDGTMLVLNTPALCMLFVLSIQ